MTWDRSKHLWIGAAKLVLMQPKDDRINRTTCSKIIDWSNVGAAKTDQNMKMRRIPERRSAMLNSEIDNY